MKSRIIVLLVLLALVFACSKKSAPPLPFEKSSEEYMFYSGLAEKAPVVNPDKNVELISTKSFSVYSSQVLPFIYTRLQGMASRGGEINAEAIEGLVQNAAVYMAEKQLLVNEASDNGIAVSPDTVQAEIEKLYAQNGGEESFIQMLEQRGLSHEYFQQDVKESMLIRNYLENVVYPKVEPTEEDLQAEYEKDKLASVRHILLTTSGKSDEEKSEIYEKMQGILERARAGEDFAELARQYTEDPGSKENGGLYEDFQRGRMVKPFEDAAFSVPVGEISDIVETDYGYHIIKVVDRKKEDAPFDQIKTGMARRLKNVMRKDAEVELLDRLKDEKNYQEMF